MRQLGIALCILVFLTPHATKAKDKKNVPLAPLPAVVVNAKKIYLSNGGGSSMAYDVFYIVMKEWGKYEIVGSPEGADLIVELAYRVERDGSRVGSSTDTTNTTHINSAEKVDPQVVLTIYDAKSKTLLWSESERPRSARRKKNRDKETVNSTQRLVAELKRRVNVPQ